MKLGKIGLVIASLLVASFIGGCGSDDTAAKELTKEESTYVTFVGLPIGSTLDDAKKAFGNECELVSENNNSQIYKWKAGNGAVRAEFENGALVRKNNTIASKLYKGDLYVTTEQFNEIKKGQTYDKVSGIMGRGGALVTEKKDVKIYIWSNPDESCAQVHFKNGFVSSKQSFRLK